MVIHDFNNDFSKMMQLTKYPVRRDGGRKIIVTIVSRLLQEDIDSNELGRIGKHTYITLFVSYEAT